MVTAIIPAYNESRGIARAIEILLSSPLIGEVIVVDDGSSDDTPDIALQSGARVIRLPRNGGKGQAMQSGIREAKYEMILFCDGDMYGFSQTGIEKIIAPIREGIADMAIGIRPIISMTRYVFPFLTQISGFRAIKKNRWTEIPEKFISGYQIELVINFVARRNDWKVLYADVPGLSHSPKETKYGILTGLVARGVMIFDIFFFFLDLYLFKRTESDKELKKARLYKVPASTAYQPARKDFR